MNSLRALIDWIIEQGTRSNSFEELAEGLCRRLVDCGYPIWRGAISLPSIDPMHRGSSTLWSDRDGTSVTIADHDRTGEADFERSPIYYLLKNDLVDGRWSLAPGGGFEAYPLLKDLSEQGGTEYLLKLAAFPNEVALRGVALSLATNVPEGFSDEQVAGLDLILPALALACYRIAATRTARDILAVYTGARTSERILSGEIRRGDGTAIYAAILFADLKSFTSLNERFQSRDIVAWLNEHFEIAGIAIERNGGEILKFMGDSVLAIFPADPNHPAKACDAALAAARSALSANAALGLERQRAGMPAIAVDIVLHLGEVFYGNVGAARRLDFTVIGKAVNEAARIEKLCDQLDRNLLLSESFAANCDAESEKVGRFSLRGVALDADVYALRR